ncbi:non-hydrolyzing UDP-N-acetylglucosamine 2-epimerase [Pollutibacter soli]|uniref:non-hydrolyzing UDP-N-acetylglucosamine 2-epimerase n=1 Tax=Pollutibacter soli TaxID=3034157 RepID=UPI0030133609
MLVTIVAGARPNFMKISPIIRAIKAAKAAGKDVEYRLVHTGQHYDKKMSHDFFEQLGIPEPDVNLEAGGGSQAEQTAGIMVKFEKELQQHRPDLILVVGDVTSTMACTITAKKLCIDAVHVEAGIRSGDMTMPEEINRIVTDSITDHFFTTSEVANENLRKNGVAESAIHFVGNTMIDTLYQHLDHLKQPECWASENLEVKSYYLVTLHRPANVDDPANLKRLLDSIISGTGNSKILFPVHPRTRKILEGLNYQHERLIQIDPQGYLEFIFLVKNAKAVITDSGGITEEATVLGIPCMTLRDSTERPETITIGTNELVGTDPRKLAPYLEKVRTNQWKKGGIPELWDGKTSERIVNILVKLYSNTVENTKQAKVMATVS